MTLDEICIKHGADKAGAHPNGGHDYARHYEKAFDSLRAEAVNLLEIGVDHGASIRVWLEYFPNGRIFGVDIEPDQMPELPRYTFAMGDQRQASFWAAFLQKHGTGWDIIIDDGGHYADMVITSFTCLWPNVKRGGFYCVEDLGSAYPNYTQGRVQCPEVYQANCIPDGWPNHMEFLKGLVDQLNLGNEIESITFSKELVIIKRNH